MPMSRGVRAVAAALLGAALLAACGGSPAPGDAASAATAPAAAGPVAPGSTAPGAVDAASDAALASAAPASAAPGRVPATSQDAGGSSEPAATATGGTAPRVETPEGPLPASAPPPPAPIQASQVPEELRFTATTLDGAAFDGADLAGKPAVLWFWAPWCPNCRAEAPQVAAAAAATAGEVTFLGVAAQDDLAPMQAFVDNYGVGGFEHLADLDAAIWQRFGVTYQPAYAFISADGTVEVVKSRVSAAELAERLGQLTAS